MQKHGTISNHRLHYAIAKETLTEDMKFVAEKLQLGHQWVITHVIGNFEGDLSITCVDLVSNANVQNFVN